MDGISLGAMMGHSAHRKPPLPKSHPLRRAAAWFSALDLAKGPFKCLQKGCGYGRPRELLTRLLLWARKNQGGSEHRQKLSQTLWLL